MVADLLRIQGDGAIYPPEETKRLLFDACESCKPNGLKATSKAREEIRSLVEILEASNPSRNPADSKLMAGFWRLLYTTATTGGNAGRLGPLTGAVYQDLNPDAGIIKNICRVDFPPIIGCLTAKQSRFDSKTW